MYAAHTTPPGEMVVTTSPEGLRPRGGQPVQPESAIT